MPTRTAPLSRGFELLEPAPAAFGILGPLEVRGHAGPVTLRGARHRGTLTALLLRANTVVPLDDMIDYLWPDRAPATAREQVLTSVSGLRRLLGDAEQPAAERLVVTRSPGYLIRIRHDQLDAHRFETHVRAAERELAGDRASPAAAALHAALALWRGPALADVSVPFAANEAHRLAELRMSAVEMLADAELRLGRHREALPRLSWLVAEHPLRERFRGQLMVALHEVGRTAEALQTYRAGRDLTVKELGLEPGAELRSIEHAILVDAGSGASSGVQRPVRAQVSVPRTPVPRPPAQLPPDITDFTGRQTEIAEIGRYLQEAPGYSALPVVAISGQAGVGKSSLAVRVGHLLRGRFPDGQLYIDIRGTTTHPRDPSAVLAKILSDLAPPGPPTDNLDELTSLYRTLMADRRFLVIVDDVADTAQVRPLLPGGPRCGVIITGRCHHADLTGAHHLRLDVWSEDDAIAALAAIAGAPCLGVARKAARDVVDACGRLPLAVRVAGAKIASRPHWSLVDLAERLADPDRRLDELRVGDLHVRASLASSVRALAPAAHAAALHLGLLPASVVTARLAADALGVAPTVAADLVEQLADHQILQYSGRGDDGAPQFRFPELLRSYLRERTSTSGPAGTVQNL